MTDAVSGTFRLGDVFSKALAIYGRRFGPFIVLTVIAQIPQYVTLFVIGAPAPGSFSAGSAVSALVGLVCTSIASGAIYGVVQELRGRVFSVADSIQIAWLRLLPMIGVAICTGILAGLASILLIVPGLMVACAYYVSVPACVAEKTGVFASMSRSAFLTKGYRWQVFGMLLLIFVGYVILAIIVGLVFGLTGGVRLVSGSTTTGGVGLIATRAVSAIVGAILGAFYGVTAGVFYYQFRVAKEGVDINKIASVFD